MKGAPETDSTVRMRIAGLVLIGAGLFSIDGGSSAPMHTLILPLVMAAGAALALRNVLAVALAVLALAGIRAEPGHPDWVVGVAYPALAAAAGLTVATLLFLRFKAYSAQTRSERHARRK